MNEHDRLFGLISELVLCHSPSGAEGEIDAFLFDAFKQRGRMVERDACGNLFIMIPGDGEGSVAITAHKDEIGALVTGLGDDGTLKAKRLGGSYPWVYGEGVVDILGDTRAISGVLSFGSRHVSHASSQHAHQEKAPLLWEDAWIETKLSKSDLDDAGVRIGSRVVVGKHRKTPLRLSRHIASYALDNKASLAILLLLAERVSSPARDTFLVASTKEEVGAIGALYFTKGRSVDDVIALEVAPVAPEYAIKICEDPVLVAHDAFGLYDDALTAAIAQSAKNVEVAIQVAALNGFGSDASVCMKAGHIARGACLGFPTQNTHGYEIADLEGIARCARILEAYCNAPRVNFGN